MLSGLWVFPVAFFASLVVATLASPAGISGAILLLPFQVSVLGTPSPSVTPTNLLYNVFATPGALYRYRRQGQTGGALTRRLLLGTLPGVIVGSTIRVEFLPGPRAFDAVIAFVLIPLGTQLVIRRSVTHPSNWTALIPLVPIAMLVGCVGGIYGIGGGSILAPILIGSGRSPSEVAPATLASTFVTSIATGAGSGRASRKLLRSAYPAASSRRHHPKYSRRSRHGNWCSLRVARSSGLTSIARSAAFAQRSKERQFEIDHSRTD
jgi:uncharacterized membrane protein YfcA